MPPKKYVNKDAYCGHCGEDVPKDELKMTSDGHPKCPKCGKKVRLHPRFKKSRKRKCPAK